MDIGEFRGIFHEQNLTFLAQTPYVYHCHHYNLFHDQTIDDALGEEEGAQVRTHAARNAARELIDGVCIRAGATTPLERIQVAAELFAWMGQGKLDLSLGDNGGSARSRSFHYGHSWVEKYGKKVRREYPCDAVAAGFAAAALEIAYDLPPGSGTAHESHCVAKRDTECVIELARGNPIDLPIKVDEECIRRLVAPPIGGIDEERIAQIAGGLVEFMRGVRGDERGLIQAFNVFVTAHMANYYDETVYETVHRVERNSPVSVPAVEALMREAGQVCVYNTFGNILLSPEWEGLVGKLSGDPADTISFNTAIARGLGFGHWLVGEYEPGKRLVVRCTSNYEAPFYTQRYGKSEKPRAYLVQGASLAMMVLAERVKWREGATITNQGYIDLFRGKLPYRVEQTQCQTKGDPISEFVVTAT